MNKMSEWVKDSTIELSALTATQIPSRYNHSHSQFHNFTYIQTHTPHIDWNHLKRNDELCLKWVLICFFLHVFVSIALSFSLFLTLSMSNTLCLCLRIAGIDRLLIVIHGIDCEWWFLMYDVLWLSLWPLISRVLAYRTLPNANDSNK